MALSFTKITEAPTGIVLRKEDQLECEALGLTVDEAIAYSVKKADASYAVYLGEKLVCLWGHRGSALGVTGYVWLLTTPVVDHIPLLFGLYSKQLLKDLLEQYLFLQVAVAKRYVKSLSWLCWLGFTPIGEAGKFLIMEIERWE